MRNKIEPDAVDRGLLNVLQSRFPLAHEPFALIAQGIAADETDVIARVRRLKRRRIIRYIGPVFDARSLGYHSTLVAMSVPDDRIEVAANIVSAHPGVSHNYLRRHRYNLWFTLTLPADVDRAAALSALDAEVVPEAMLDLPALRRFKVRAVFDVDGGGIAEENAGTDIIHSEGLNAADWTVIDALQRELPVVRRPFDVMSKKAGMQSDDFIERCERLRQRGVMRRFGAALAHTRAGYAANAMVCWVAPRDSVEDKGRIMSSFAEVSHCYERETRYGWPYNLYTMIHGGTEQECRDAIGRIASRSGIDNYEALFTAREFKKERVVYKPPTCASTKRRYYPLSLDIGGRRCVVVGGGEVALRKSRALLEHGALVQVIAAELCPGIEALAADGRITAARRRYRRGDLCGAFVAIAATDNADINRKVAGEAASLGILINVVDSPVPSNFIVPACLRRGDLSIAVSTGGASPALARRIRERLEVDFGEEYEALLELVGRVRSDLKKRNIVIPADTWNEALDLDVLLNLLRKERTEQAERYLIDRLTERGEDARC